MYPMANTHKHRYRGCPPALGLWYAKGYNTKLGKVVIEPCKDPADAVRMMDSMRRDENYRGVTLDKRVNYGWQQR